MKNEDSNKLKPKIKKGRAYLNRLHFSEPIISIDVEVPEGQEHLAAAHKLMENFRIEFVEGG